MIREHFEFRQTITTILADSKADIEAAKSGILKARMAVESAVSADPFLLSTFEPYDPGFDHPVIQRMVAAGSAAGVGPMAAVAGTIAWAGVEAMADAGARFGVVDNGGDIALFSDRPIRIGIYAGDLRNRAFLLPPQERISGVCTSSATVGPSISFGSADAVTVFSPDVSVADAYATALCNRLSPGDYSALSDLEGSPITGVLALFGEEMVVRGEVPDIVLAEVDTDLITRGLPAIPRLPRT